MQPTRTPWYLGLPNVEFEYRWTAEDFEDFLADQKAYEYEEYEDEAYRAWLDDPARDVLAHLGGAA